VNGKNHDRGILIMSGLIVAATLPTMPALTLPLVIGNTVGGLWLSPDLDLAHSRPSKRWGLLAWYWDVYRMLCGRHRSWLSHGPFVGSLGRLLYIGWPAWVFGWYHAWDDMWLGGILIGVFVSEFVHLLSDWLADNFGVGK
jgi:uncharacterized metal-binding protein